MNFSRVVLVGLAFLFAGAAFAQAYPARPLRFVIGFGAGGPTDLGGRMLAEHLTTQLGQPVIVENRPGDGAIIAHRSVAQQPADGYTLLYTGDYAAFYPYTAQSWDLDLLKDFSYVGTFATNTGTLILAPAQAPFRDMSELIAYAKANPGKVNWAFAGIAPYSIFMRYFNKVFGLGMVEVPYKSAAEAKLATLRGDVSLYPDAPAAANDKALRPILFTGTMRHPQYPQVPTLLDGEVAKLGLAFNSYSGMLGPANIPPEIVARLNAALAVVVKNKDWIDRMGAMGQWPRHTTPSEYRAMMASDLATNAKLAKEIGLTRQ